MLLLPKKRSLYFKFRFSLCYFLQDSTHSMVHELRKLHPRTPEKIYRFIIVFRKCIHKYKSCSWCLTFFSYNMVVKNRITLYSDQLWLCLALAKPNKWYFRCLSTQPSTKVLWICLVFQICPALSALIVMTSASRRTSSLRLETWPLRCWAQVRFRDFYQIYIMSDFSRRLRCNNLSGRPRRISYQG